MNSLTTPKTGLGGVHFDGATNGVHRLTGAHCVDAGEQRTAGVLHQMARVLVDVSNHERHRRVPVYPFAVDGDIHVHYVSILQTPRIGYAMTYNFVH